MKRNTIQGLIVVLIFCGTISTASAEEAVFSASYSLESLEDGSAWTLGVETGAFDVFYGGLSISSVTSSQLKSYRDSETLSQLNLFMGLQAPWLVSPYIEGGIDLVEAFIDSLFRAEDEESSDSIDYYLAAGIKYPLSDRFTVSLYARKYAFIYRNQVNTKWLSSKPEGYGVGISMHF